VFVNVHTGKPLTTGGLRAVFRKLGKRAGLGLISPPSSTPRNRPITNSSCSRLCWIWKP
jgi:hypothetical protein